MFKTLKWLLVIIVFCIGGYFLAEWKMKKELISFLNRKIPNHIDFSYDRITTDLFRGNINFVDVVVVNTGKQTSSCEIKVDADELSIKGFSYWKILFNNSIYLKSLTLTKPHLYFKTCPRNTNNTNINKRNPIHLLKEIFVEELIFEAGKVEIWDANEEIELIAVESIDLSLKKIKTNPKIVTEYVPFNFLEYNIEVQNFNAPLGDFERLQMESMVVNNSTINVTNFLLSTKFSKVELSKEIKYQRDYTKLSIPSIKVQNHNYSVSNDSLQINYKELLINVPNLEIYRDKSRLEDYRNKPLYGELLQKLPFKVAIDSTFIKKGTIIYEENISSNANAGALSFENLDASISNISNMANVQDDLKIQLNADLMGTGKFHLNWEFDVFDPQDAFLISGGLSNFNTVSLNDFLVPNLRTRTTGTINQLYFTISGNKHKATGDIKMSYEDFKFQVLNKERNGVKEILSLIGNLFVKDGSRANKDGFRYGTISTERTKNKSFFNYLWINLQDGLLSVLTGNGQKK